MNGIRCAFCRSSIDCFATLHTVSLIPFPHHDLHTHRDEPANEGGGVDEAAAAPAPGGLTDADFDSNWDEAIETFDAMEIPEELLRGIYSYGFEKPSAIQQRAIKPTTLGRDLIAQAQSGTVRDEQFLSACL